METIKEEKKADLEQLLNSLIKRGRIPFGEKCKTYEWIFLSKSTRDLVSIDSGLWQFVCENGMIKKDQYTNTTRIQEYEDERDSETYRTKYDEGSYLFRLIESSLKDESELEDFLLSNIKVNVESK